MKKWVYVIEILFEVIKTVLPFIKARKITIDSSDNREAADENV